MSGASDSNALVTDTAICISDRSQRPVLVPGHHVFDRSLAGLALGLALPFGGLGACALATQAAAGGGEVDSPRDLQGGS